MLSFDVEVMLLKAFVEFTCPPHVHRCASNSTGLYGLCFMSPCHLFMSPTLATLYLRSSSLFVCHLAMAEITANPLASDTADPHRLWNEAELANLRLDPSRGEGPLISSLKPGCQPHRHSR